jgi:hypothetical protein
MRLNAIAQVRAQTIAARISPNVRQPGQPRLSRAATAIAASANGRAKTVCEKRTNEAHFLMKENIQHSTFNAQHRSISRLRRRCNCRDWTIGAIRFGNSVWLSGCLNEKCGSVLRFHPAQTAGGFIFDPRFPFDEPCPAARLPQFFQANFEFVNEIVARFRSFSFAMVGIWRSAGTQNLSGDVIARPRRLEVFPTGQSPPKQIPAAGLQDQIFAFRPRLR